MNEQDTRTWLEAYAQTLPSGKPIESFDPQAVPDFVNLISDSVLFYAAFALVIVALVLCTRNKPQSVQRALVFALAGIAFGLLLIGKNW